MTDEVKEAVIRPKSYWTEQMMDYLKRTDPSTWDHVNNKRRLLWTSARDDSYQLSSHGISIMTSFMPTWKTGQPSGAPGSEFYIVTFKNSITSESLLKLVSGLKFPWWIDNNKEFDKLFTMDDNVLVMSFLNDQDINSMAKSL